MSGRLFGAVTGRATPCNVGTVGFASLENEDDGRKLYSSCCLGRMTRWTGLKSFGAVDEKR